MEAAVSQGLYGEKLLLFRGITRNARRGATESRYGEHGLPRMSTAMTGECGPSTPSAASEGAQAVAASQPDRSESRRSIDADGGAVWRRAGERGGLQVAAPEQRIGGVCGIAHADQHGGVGDGRRWPPQARRDGAPVGL